MQKWLWAPMDPMESHVGVFFPMRRCILRECWRSLPPPASPNTTIRIRDPHQMFKSSDLGEVSREAGRWGQAYFDFFPVANNIAGYVWDFPTQVNGEAMRCWGIYDTNILANEKRPPTERAACKRDVAFWIRPGAI